VQCLVLPVCRQSCRSDDSDGEVGQAVLVMVNLAGKGCVVGMHVSHTKLCVSEEAVLW